MISRKISVMQQNDNQDDRLDDHETRLRALEKWQSFVLGATAAFWIFVSGVAWWLSKK